MNSILTYHLRYVIVHDKLSFMAQIKKKQPKNSHVIVVNKKKIESKKGFKKN